MRRLAGATGLLAIMAVQLPLTLALAEPPQRARDAPDLKQELDRKQQERFQEQLRRAREADRLREADRASRAREAQEREAQAAERGRETREAARIREEREAASLHAAREAERDRSSKRNSTRRDRNVPAPPSR